MANIIFPKRWTQKPPNPTLNWGHPLAKGARLIAPLSEFGQATASTGVMPWRDLVRMRPATMVGSGLASQVQTQGGQGVNFANTDIEFRFGADSEIPIPTSRVTVLVIRRKTDGTARACSMAGVTGASGTELFNIHCPYSDGNVYWDFGGSTSPNRLSYTPATVTGVQKWAFVAGGNGSAIYLNGVQQASQGTAITRTNAGNFFTLNNGAAGSGDLADYYFFAVLDAEWTASMVQWWNAEPYAMFSAAPPLRRIFVPPAAAAPVSTAFGDDSWGIVGISGWDQKLTVF